MSKQETIDAIFAIVMSGDVNDEQCEKLLAVAYELEVECSHPALYESCPDYGQGSTWYCPDCESVIEGVEDE